MPSDIHGFDLDLTARKPDGTTAPILLGNQARVGELQYHGPGATKSILDCCRGGWYGKPNTRRRMGCSGNTFATSNAALSAIRSPR
jgi:hypothetical protein